jgi:hypothetical protein
LIGLVSQLYLRMMQQFRISVLTGGKTRAFGNDAFM